MPRGAKPLNFRDCAWELQSPAWRPHKTVAKNYAKFRLAERGIRVKLHAKGGNRMMAFQSPTGPMAFDSFKSLFEWADNTRLDLKDPPPSGSFMDVDLIYDLIITDPYRRPRTENEKREAKEVKETARAAKKAGKAAKRAEKKIERERNQEQQKQEKSELVARMQNQTSTTKKLTLMRSILSAPLQRSQERSHELQVRATTFKATFGKSPAAHLDASPHSTEGDTEANNLRNDARGILKGLDCERKHELLILKALCKPTTIGVKKVIRLEKELVFVHPLSEALARAQALSRANAHDTCNENGDLQANAMIKEFPRLFKVQEVFHNEDGKKLSELGEEEAGAFTDEHDTFFTHVKTELMQSAEAGENLSSEFVETYKARVKPKAAGEALKQLRTARLRSVMACGSVDVEEKVVLPLKSFLAAFCTGGANNS
ncbi:hypothetical protein TeGR_g12083, partial [Tetraparma gracilis]